MPRNFSELKSGGGTIPMLSPHPEKWGDARVGVYVIWYSSCDILNICPNCIAYDPVDNTCYLQ